MTKDNLDPDPIDVDVGAIIRDRRKYLKMSQNALGAALDISFQQIQKYERGTNRVSASALCKIAQHLNMDPADLLPASCRPTPDKSEVRAPQAPGLGDLTEIFVRLSPERRALLIAIAKQVARPEALT